MASTQCHPRSRPWSKAACTPRCAIPLAVIHGGAIVAGAAAARASRQASLDIPKHIIIDGPIVTKANAAGMLWMEEQFLI